MKLALFSFQEDREGVRLFPALKVYQELAGFVACLLPDSFSKHKSIT